MTALWRALPGSWQEKSLVVLGLFLAASPWLMAYQDSAAPTGNAVAIGSVFVLGGAIAIVRNTNYADYVVAFLAFWLVLASRILGYDTQLVPTLVDISFGAAGIVLALWAAGARSRAIYRSGVAIQPVEPPSPPASPSPLKPGETHRRAA